MVKSELPKAEDFAQCEKIDKIIARLHAFTCHA